MEEMRTDQIDPFHQFINQIALCADRDDLYFVALMAALALPDICGALEAETGVATGKLYAAWFDKWVGPKYIGGPEYARTQFLTGAQCYGLRCAALHQGRLENDRPGAVHVAFFEPGTSINTYHNNLVGGYLNIDVRIFCADMVHAAFDWWEDARFTDAFQDNFERSMKRHAYGFGPFQGGPVIA